MLDSKPVAFNVINRWTTTIDQGSNRPTLRVGMAGLLSGESLDGYSLDELDARIGLLEAEIARVAEHRSKASDHMHAADALFGRKE